MGTARMLLKQKVVSVSDLQKNPSKALDAGIVLIVKNGNKMGIYMSKEEFEDFVEENLLLKDTFKRDLDNAIRNRKDIYKNL